MSLSLQYDFEVDGREREIARLRVKHPTETGVLLGVLADAQGAVRKLRNENARVHAEVGQVKKKSTALRAENQALRRSVRR